MRAGLQAQGARRVGPPALLICSSMWGRGVNACTALNLYNLKAQSPPTPPPRGGLHKPQLAHFLGDGPRP